jgi:hypothetical protein
MLAYVTCRRCRACDQRVACSVPGFGAMKQGTRRYEEARKRQERSPCAPGWLACGATNDAEILLSQNDAEVRHREYQIQRERKIAPGRNVRPRFAYRPADRPRILHPGIPKTYGSDGAYATEADGDKVPRRMSFRAFSEDPARTVEPALFLGRKRLDGVAWCRVREREGGRRRRVTHGPPVMRDPVVAGGEGRLPEHQQSGECRGGP